MEKLNVTPETQLSVSDAFEKQFGVLLIEISYADVPERVVEFFESQSAKFIAPEDYKVENFDALYVFVHTDGDTTYIAQQNKTYSETSLSIERLVYLCDTRDQQITGYLEIRFSITDKDVYFKNKPFVGVTRTLEQFQRQGLAQRRLLEANAYSLSTYGFPLNSDTVMTNEAKSLWEKFVTEGVAEQYDENGKIRFRFIA